MWVKLCQSVDGSPVWVGLLLLCGVSLGLTPILTRAGHGGTPRSSLSRPEGALGPLWGCLGPVLHPLLCLLGSLLSLIRQCLHRGLCSFFVTFCCACCLHMQVSIYSSINLFTQSLKLSHSFWYKSDLSPAVHVSLHATLCVLWLMHMHATVGEQVCCFLWTDVLGNCQ